MDPADHVAAILVLAVAGIYPAMDGKRFSARLAKLADGPDDGRVNVYRELLVFLWAIGALVVGVWALQGRSFEALGLRHENTWRFWAVCGAVGAIAAFYLATCLRLGASPELRARMIRSLKQSQADPLIPRNARELKYWSICSLSASLEEIVYRGFILWYVATVTNLVLAIAVSCVIFAAAHSYQGVTGLLRTLAYGMVLVLVYLVSGSLWPAIVLHVVQDAFAGTAGYLSLTSQDKNSS